MIVRLLSPRLQPLGLLRHLSTCRTTIGLGSPRVLVDSAFITSTVGSVASANPRLQHLAATAAFLAGRPLLLPSAAPAPRAVVCPTLESLAVKRFIYEEVKKVEEPEVPKAEVRDPRAVVSKHAIRMIVLRRKKMKKHQRKKLWQKMGLRFKANIVAREKRKELEFRARLQAKVTAARKFSAERHLSDYLEDFHRELLPKTYQGHRLPEWLIKELMEKDREDAKEAAMAGREVTTGEEVVRRGETVEQFIKRQWK